MPQLIQSIDDFLYEKKRDIYVLQIIDQTSHFKLIYDENSDANKITERKQLEWFDENHIKYYFTCTAEHMCGWNGLYYIDFTDHNDPLIKAYSSKFENKEGNSLEPTQYQLYCVEYNKWVKSGGLKIYLHQLEESA